MPENMTKAEKCLHLFVLQSTYGIHVKIAERCCNTANRSRHCDRLPLYTRLHAPGLEAPEAFGTRPLQTCGVKPWWPFRARHLRRFCSNVLSTCIVFFALFWVQHKDWSYIPWILFFQLSCSIIGENAPHFQHFCTYKYRTLKLSEICFLMNVEMFYNVKSVYNYPLLHSGYIYLYWLGLSHLVIIFHIFFLS